MSERAKSKRDDLKREEEGEGRGDSARVTWRAGLILDLDFLELV